MIRRTNLGLSLASFMLTLWALWHVGPFIGAVGHGPAWAYPLGVLAVLVAHEAGHMAAAWWIGLTPGWPIFFPWPLPVAAWLGWPWLPAFGTLGAWVPLPGLRRRSGDDQWLVAMSGLVAGFLVSAGLVGFGIVLSEPVSGPHVWSRLPVPWLLSVVVPKGVIWSPALVAGWLGLMLTWLNALPLPGFDGWKLWAYWDEYSTGQKWGTVLLGGGAVCGCFPGF